MSNTQSPQSALRHFEYALVDVFAERVLEGNMLAIFTDARGLSDSEMQALARETNLAETTFILPAEDPAVESVEGVRVRIFTTEEELPFAGHPTLGTASWLYLHHPALRGTQSVTLALKGGPVTVHFRKPAAGERGVCGTMRQHDPVFGSIHDRATVAAVTGLPLDAFDPAWPIQTVSTGLPFCIVPVRSLAAVERMDIPRSAAERYLATTDAKFFYVFAPAPRDSSADFHARMQFYSGEDPATGSASGCAISYMVRYGLVESAKQIVLEQGCEIRRPSKIFVSAALTCSDVTHVFVGGRTISVATGIVSL